jgi:hypothetical protein
MLEVVKIAEAKVKDQPATMVKAKQRNVVEIN